MSNFDKEYAKLNTQQKEAVNSTEGPLLVIAGPGTGKTQLLSMRVANILKKTDTTPENILCLTFTNKAALNMRERLLRLTDGGGSKVLIKTFHSFAAEIMSLYPNYFWNGARLTTVPDTVQDEIISNVLYKLPLDHPLAVKFAGQFTSISEVKNGLQLTKEAGLTPAKLQSVINANLAYLDIIEPALVEILGQTLSYKKLADISQAISVLPDQGIDESYYPLTSLTTVIKDSLKFAIERDAGTGKTTNTGKWKAGLIQSENGIKKMYKERARNNWWLGLAEVYELYRSELHNRGFYDYSDMLVEVISAIEQNPSLHSDLKEHFLYVLIDEFQDSNSAQMRLAHLVSSDPQDAKQPNLMVVGDDDQSIYKFNGAELANMLTFRKNYPDSKVVILTDNYRSSQEVLDTASKIIELASDRLSLRDPSINKVLYAKNPPEEEGQIISNHYANQAHQNIEVAKDIQKQYSQGNSSIAVLARNNDSLRNIASELNKLGVPLSFHEQNNILENPIITMINQVAALIVAVTEGDLENSNHLLSQILRHPMWGIKPFDLWNLAIANKNKDWLSALHDTPTESRLHEFYDWLQSLATQSTIEPLQVMIEYIIGLRPGERLTSPIIGWYIENQEVSSDYLRGLSAIRKLLTEVDEFSALAKGSLKELVLFINSVNDSGRIIADESIFITGEGAIELMSVHKAKGLEFDTVYIIDAIDDNWKPRSPKRKAPLNLALQPAFDDLDDYIRLMYVAVTRAKRSIIFTSYKQDNKNKELLTTPLIASIEEHEVDSPDDDTKIAALESSLSWPQLNTRDETLLLKPLLENLKLSASSLIDYLDITSGGPANFKERHLLRLPGTKTANMAFGTAMHAALEYAQIKTNLNRLNVPAVIKYFSSSLKSQNITQSETIKYTKYGEDLLQKLLTSDTFWLPKGSLPEQPLSALLNNTIPLFGKLDRVDLSDNQLAIVDYKTGKPLPSLDTKNKSLEIKAWRYKTQLAFYCLLSKNSSRFSKLQKHSAKIIFLEAGSPKELVREYTPTAEELANLEILISAVWTKIINLDFADTSQYSQSLDGIIKFQQDLMNITG